MRRFRVRLDGRLTRARSECEYGNFAQTIFRDRISRVWHPSGMHALRASGSGGIVAGAPQPPANFCDPYRGQDGESRLPG
jgi:hypothetical protein